MSNLRKHKESELKDLLSGLLASTNELAARRRERLEAHKKRREEDNAAVVKKYRLKQKKGEPKNVDNNKKRVTESVVSDKGGTEGAKIFYFPRDKRREAED